jgi:hypothetical protein
MELKMAKQIFSFITFVILTFFMANNVYALQYTFHPRASATQQYTDNVFLSEDNEKDDWITIVSPAIPGATMPRCVAGRILPKEPALLSGIGSYAPRIH